MKDVSVLSMSVNDFQNIGLLDKKVVHNAAGRYLIRVKKKDFKKKTYTKTFIAGSYRTELKFSLPNQE